MPLRCPHGRLDPKIEMIQKPFTEAALAARIRELLDHARGLTQPP
jgi:hypothetical protein